MFSSAVESFSMTPYGRSGTNIHWGCCAGQWTLFKQKSPNTVQARLEVPGLVHLLLALSFLAEVVLGAADPSLTTPVISSLRQSLLIMSIRKCMTEISLIKTCYLKRERFHSRSARDCIKALALCLINQQGLHQHTFAMVFKGRCLS